MLIGVGLRRQNQARIFFLGLKSTLRRDTNPTRSHNPLFDFLEWEADVTALHRAYPLEF